MINTKTIDHVSDKEKQIFREIVSLIKESISTQTMPHEQHTIGDRYEIVGFEMATENILKYIKEIKAFNGF